MKKKSPTIKDIKQMVAEPASKEWFQKHGSPKSKALNKKTRYQKPVKTYGKFRVFREEEGISNE